MKKTISIILAILMIVGTMPFALAVEEEAGTDIIDATDMTADELKDAMAAWLADGNTDIPILLTAYADQEMFSAIWTAFSESTAADGSIDLTISGAKTVPDYGFFDNDNYFANDDKNIAGDKLKSLTLTDVETIGDFAFSACTYLESVNLPQVVTIGEYAFNEWKKGTKLTSLNLPNATTIGDWAFAYSSLLTSVNLPKVTSIGEHAFGYCDLRTLDLPEATTIGGEAFMNNDNIVSCSAPKATTIGYYPWGSNRTSKLERLELTAAGDFTLGNNLFAYTPTEQIDLVLNKDKESQVTQNEDGTATWATTNQYGGSLTYTFKSITLTCVDGTTNHSYTYTDQENGTYKAECTVEGCGFYKYEAHTFDANSYTDNNDGTHDATCTACGAVVVDNEAHTGGTATCTTLAVCENCGTEYGDKDTLNHKDTLVQVDAKAPTCTEIGWDAYEYCTACDYSTYEELPAITHTDANCDYKCDYNCGYVYETLDFSDAKVLTANEKGILCIDGVQVEYDTHTVTSTHFRYNQYLPSGKYKLSGDVTMHKNGFIYIEEGENVSVDLNGYTWNCNDCTYTDGTFSVYDTSKDEKGKITSSYGLILVRGDGEFNLYSGTIENSKGGVVLRVVEGTANLYGGKLKSNEYTIEHILYKNAKINLGSTVLENEEGYPEIVSVLSLEVPQGVINVADYTGESLTVEIDSDYAGYAGKIKILEGVENAQEAEKYTIKFYKNDSCYLDKTEYNEETGEMFAYTAKYAFTQQPSAENGYTVDFNNTDVTFQWYEVEETILTPNNVTAIEGVTFKDGKWLNDGWYVEFFTVDVEAGDMITVSTTSARSFDLNVYTEDYSINECVTTTGKASVTIDSDAEVIVGIAVNINNETTEFEIELIKISEVDETETDKTLQNPECGKTYVCKTSVGENVYLSDVVTGHNIVSVDAKAPTCTEIGWEAYEYCTECDYTTYAEKAKLGHDIVTDKAVAPTCTKTGLTEGQHCTRCDAMTIIQEVVPALNHKGTLVQVEAKAKTCKEAGHNAHEYCTECDYTTKVEIPASHELQEVKAKAPTCEAIGYDAYKYCTECDYTTYVEKAKLGHDIIIDEAKTATCTATGLTEGSHCTRCDGATVKQDVIPKKGHTEIKGGTEKAHTICDVCEDVLSAEHEFASKITTEPTYTKEGIKTFTCECGYSYEEVIPCLVQGEIKAEEAESNSFSATVVDINSIVTKLQLTEEEKTLIEQGADMKIVFKLSDIGATINTPEKEAIFKALTNEKIAVFLDIQLVKQIANSSVNVQKLNDLIKVTVELPAELVNKDGNIKRSYSVLRYHDGDETKVTTLNAKFDEATGTLTFDTDRFSTYAIVYSDVVVSNGEGALGTLDPGDGEVSTPETPKDETTPNTPEVPKDNVSNDKNDISKDDVPKAGVISTTSIWLGAMALSGFGALLVSKKKKEND